MKTKIKILKTWMLYCCFCLSSIGVLAQNICSDPLVSYQYDNNSSIDDCCWFITIDNMSVSNLITSIELDNFVDCEIGSLMPFGSWTVPSQTNTSATILPNTTFLQPGLYSQQFKVCLANRTAIPHFFDVVFIATDPNGIEYEHCRSEIVLDCPISEDPCLTTACFNPVYQGGSTYNFDGTCSTGNGSLSYAWDFGDGNSSTLMSPSHTYTSNQPIYNVCLTTTNTVNGTTCTDVSCISIDSPVTPPGNCDNSCPLNTLDLVVNGDFAAGDTGFSSGLASNCSCAAGTYCVTTDARLKCNNALWNTVFSPGSDNYLVVDGSIGPIWSQVVNVVNGQNYTFSFDHYPNISGSTVFPPLALFVNGNVVLNNITGTAATWTTHCVDWTANLTGAVVIEIQQTGTAAFDDYGIDNVQFTTCCDLEISMVDTITVCENDMVQLNPIISGAIGSVSYNWSPSTGLSNPNIANPSLTSTLIQTYTVTATDSLGCSATASVTVNPLVCPCNDQVLNGDFELGDTGFTSGLSSACSCQAASYCVTTDARLKCNNSLWQSVVAPQGFGNYLVVDGSNGSTIWSQNVNVICGSLYDFCFDYYPNVSGDPSPQLMIDVVVNGVSTNIITTTGTSDSWQKICTNGWSAPITGTIELRISQSSAAGFDDYGIDNIQFGTCCDLEVDLPDTMAVCENDTIQFNPVISGGVGQISYSWSPTTGLNNPNIANPMLTVTNTATYILTAMDSLGCEAKDTVVVSPLVCPCNDQVINGDFELGDTGFTSGLSSACSCQAASYCVTTDARLKCNNSLWQSVIAPQGFGNYLVVDGSNGSTIWSQNVSVVAGHVYDFCFDYYPNVSGDPAPQLSVDFDPVGLGINLLTTSGTTGAWQKICVNGWVAPTSGTFELRISQSSTAGFDDYGIDNIQFGTCCDLEVDLPDTIAVCENDTIQFNPIISGGTGSITYSWMPTIGLSNPNIANPMLTVTNTATYVLTAMDSLGCEAKDTVVINPLICPCNDQIINGDFELGDTGFTSGLSSTCSCQAASYCVTTDARLKCNNSLWQSVVAPQGFGNYLVIDGSNGSTIWSQNVSVVAGHVYDFCFDYYPNVSGDPAPQLSVDFDPVGLGVNLLTTSGTTGAWQKICVNGWVAPTSGTFELRISQSSTAGFDDYGIDNIQFGTCCELEVSLSDTLMVCENDLVQFNPVITGAIGQVTYNWTPATGLSNPNIANPTLTAITQTSYTLMVTDSLGCEASALIVVDPIPCGGCDNNLVENWDFELGDTGFSSGLSSLCSCQAASYCVTTDARLKCNNSLWQQIFAPGGSGNYLVVDGSNGSTIWSQNINVISGVSYDFCFDYFPSISNDPGPQLDVEIYQGTSLLNTVVSTNGIFNTWQTICASPWVSTVTGSIELRITQASSQGFDDYGIDNILFCDSLDTNVNTPVLATSIKVFPNPTFSEVTISLGEGLDVGIPYRVYDLLGRELKSGIIQAGSTQQRLNLKEVSAGMYLLFIGDEINGCHQEKLIKRE